MISLYRLKKIAAEVNKQMVDPNHSMDLTGISDSKTQKRLKNAAKEVLDEMKTWEKTYKLNGDFGGIGTDAIYLMDDQNMFLQTTKKGNKVRKGKYYGITKSLIEGDLETLKTKMTKLNREEKKKQDEIDKEKDAKKKKKLEVEKKTLETEKTKIQNDIDKVYAKVKPLEDKTKELINAMKEVAEPLKNERKADTRVIDLTPSNSNIQQDTTLLDVCRVLQAYDHIEKERFWGEKRFKVLIGGRNVEFTLGKAPLGKFQIFYEIPVSAEKYGGTKYKDNVFKKLDEIKGTKKVKGKDVEDEELTKNKQIKVAEFMLENLKKSMKDQPTYDNLIKDKKVPISELNDVKFKRVVEDFILLTNVIEAAVMPEKQLEYWVKKIKESRDTNSPIDIDTSGDIEELKKPGASLEDYKSSGRTIALDTVMRDLLERFLSGLKKGVIKISQVFSDKEYPAQLLGGTAKSKEWAKENQDRPLLSSIEFAPLVTPITSNAAPASTSNAAPSTSTASTTATGSTQTTTTVSGSSPDATQVLTNVNNGFLNPSNIGSSATDVVQVVDQNNQRGIKRTASQSDYSDTRRKAFKAAMSNIVKSDGSPCNTARRNNVCSFKDKQMTVDENSVKLDEGVLSFDLHEVHNKDQIYTAKANFDPEALSSVKYAGEQEKYARDSKRASSHSKVGTAFGIHGTVMTIFGTINSFQRGDIEKGAISTVQAVHSFGSLTRINEIIEKVGEKALLKGVSKGAAKVGLNKVADAATSKLLKLAERDSERLLGDIPYVGLAFDAYFIAEDLTDLKKAVKKGNVEDIALSSVHLILDVGTTVANLVVDVLGPEFEPVVWALSLIRMAIDDFYIDIKTELMKAHGTGEKVLAFFKGLGEGLVDFFTGGLLRSLKQLNERKKHDNELLNKFANPRLYFNVSSDCKTADFTDGSFSSYGGALSFKLHDDGSFTVTLSNVPGKDGLYSTKTKSFKCPGLSDIILGIGQSQSLKWTEQTAKLWGFIPVTSAQVIDKFMDDKNSLYGSYTGNEENNTFIAYQGNFSKVLPDECKDPGATGVIDFRLKNYFYILNGMAGNDTFFLGPEGAHVTGGEGHDLYYLGSHGGNTVIDNFAYDKLSDTLWLNVSHAHVICGRKDYDLLIAYCGTHLVKIRNWFSPAIHDFRRHLVILTRDGVQLKIKDMGFLGDRYVVDCVPLSIDLSKSDKGQYLDLSKPPYTEVVTVTGSSKKDTLIGNAEANFINAGPGSNVIKGGEGEDTYIVKLKDGCDHIDNYAENQSQDKLFIPLNYRDIEITVGLEKERADGGGVSVDLEDLKISKKPKAGREGNLSFLFNVTISECMTPYCRQVND